MRVFSRFLPAAALGVALSLPLSLPLAAEESPNLMIVLDASGSMWGQVGGRTKIELAREALSSVLSEVTPGMEIGLLTYGHRVRGQCSDIELLVPMGPAPRTVPAILGAAGQLNPRGMTPLTDAVMQAAEGMGYTEQAATVVLLTDGIETCNGDPCALGRMLAARGVDFRAHVVGFDLNDAEQRQVSCLAEETGGMFLAANSAGELRDALAQTLSVERMPEPAPAPEPVLAPRRIDLILRDVAGGPVLTGRPFRSVEFQPLDEGAGAPGALQLDLNPGQRTGRATLVPGQYRLMIVRETEGRNLIRIALPVDIPAGSDPYTLDLVIAARLQLNAFVSAGQPRLERDTRLPRLTGQGRAEFAIHPLNDGAIDASVDYGGINSRDVALPPGEYFIRGTLSEMFTRELLVSVAPGVTTTVDFDFGAAPVSVDLRDPQGFPVNRSRAQVFDLDGEEPFADGPGRDRTQLLPAYLPEGHWRIVAREDRGGAPTAEAFVRVTAGQPVTLALSPGMRGDPTGLPEDAETQCLSVHRTHGCVVEAVTPLHVVRHLGLNGRAVGEQVAPRFTGTWQTQGGMMALVQDGRRVWGEVHVNGGIGLVWGHVSPDGLTLRGAMDRSSSPRGAVELRIDAHADTLVGFWDQNIGRASQTVTARRLSGGVPPLARATGTEDDLRLTQRGEAWAPAVGSDFAAFMEPALAPASADTGEDIDAMQQFAPPMGFHGIWNTSSGQMELVVEGRSVRGQYRGNRPLIGELSADGSRLRGIWVHDNGREWGTIALELDPARMAFSGGWGRNLDPDLRGGAWTGTRTGWLASDPGAATLPAQASGAAWDAFMEPVRDPDPVVSPAEPAPAPLPDRSDAGGLPDLIPSGLAGFAPALRFDYAHADGRPAVSFVFAEGVAGGEDGMFWPGYAWLHADWCGPGCAAEILPVGGSTLDEGANSPERLDKGGVFPALDLSLLGIVAFAADGSDWRNVSLSVVVLDQPYTEGEQLGRNDARVMRRFGPFAGGILRPATMDGWPMPDDTSPAPDVLPPIGAFDRLPEQGIFAAMADRPGEAILLAFDRLFGPDQRASLRQACTDEPWVLSGDGLMTQRLLDPGTAQAGARAYRSAQAQRCEHNGPLLTCQVFRRPQSMREGVPDFDYTATVIAGPDGSFALQDPDSGRAMLYRNCQGSDEFLTAQDRWPDGRLVLDTLLAPEEQAAMPAQRADLSPVPPGLWHTEAPWSDPMPARGTAAFADRCYDEVSATWPDGVTLGLMYQNTAKGPEFMVNWSEQCRPSGDPVWPYTCNAEDAITGDLAGVEPSVSRMQIDTILADRVELTLLTEYDPNPGRFVLHACHGSGGVDLTGDPRGRALARALAAARPGLPLPEPRPVDVVEVALVPENPTAPAADPRAALAGLWFGLRDGRSRAEVSDNEARELCFEAPARLHADGLFVIFRTESGEMVADSHMRCDSGMQCDFAPGRPSGGGPVQGRAALTLMAPGEMRGCLNGQCLTIAQCPPLDWSARERSSGLASRWEAATEQRD